MIFLGERCKEDVSSNVLCRHVHELHMSHEAEASSIIYRHFFNRVTHTKNVVHHGWGRSTLNE